MLNAASPLPLYHQLAELLGRQIAEGDLAPGARIPSEPELAREHGIGRPTVRQATELLVQRGLIERRRGSGTYVRQASPRVDLFSLAGTLTSFAERGLSLDTRTVKRLKRGVVPADPENPFSEREAYNVVRVSAALGAPVLLEKIFLDPAVFRDLHRFSFGSVSLSRLVEEHYHLRPSKAEQAFRAALPTPETRRLLALAPGEALLVVKRTLDFPGAPRAVFAELHCRTDRITFSQTIDDRRGELPHE
ncbi:MAG TPA: GntR family transcriptional regulator [Polyangiaceae bacterium]|nr:GntR family transcriptional regulator [Polyangiaceae bacterium]